MLGKTNDYGVDGELRGITAEQASSAEQHGLDFLKKVVRFPGVRINRDEFLRHELTKLRASEEVIERALATSPALAGVPLLALDTLANETITYETNKSAALSFAAGLPGGFAMLGTIPADLMQYYAHALRIMQKLAYLYGWRDLLADVDEDDEMLGVLAVFFGVMLGVGGAAQSLTAFARIAAKTAYQKHVTKRALMSITWYPVVKYSLRVIGINITKSSFTKGASKIVPVIGGFVSSGLTFMALQTQSARLKGHLRELPPPGIDAEMWKQGITTANSVEQEQGIVGAVDAAFQGRVGIAAVGVVSAASGVTSGVKGLFGHR